MIPATSLAGLSSNIQYFKKGLSISFIPYKISHKILKQTSPKYKTLERGEEFHFAVQGSTIHACKNQS